MPSSHLWDFAQNTPRKIQCLYAETNHTDAFMVLKACFHGGYTTTMAGEEKFFYSTFFTIVWIRQEENEYLANDIEKINSLPE